MLRTLRARFAAAYLVLVAVALLPLAVLLGVTDATPAPFMLVLLSVALLAALWLWRGRWLFVALAALALLGALAFARMDRTAPPAAALNTQLADVAELVGARYDHNRVRAGDELRVTLVWLAHREVNDNFKLFVRDSGASRVLIDPTLLSDANGHMSLDWWEPSPNGVHVVYGLSKDGSEDSVLHILSVADGRDLPERIPNTETALPAWLETGYRTALLSNDPAVHGLIGSAPHLAGIPILINVPAVAIVLAITWLLVIGVRESSRANNIMVAIKLLVLTLFVCVGIGHIHPANYHPFAPNGFAGIHHGAAIVFFAYIGFDAVSTAAEETKNPQRNLPIGILGGLAICTAIYIIGGIVLTGRVPSHQLGVADPLARALELSGLTTVSWVVALGAIISLSAVLLVFQYGQPRIFFAMARDGLLPKWAARVHGKYRTPYMTTIVTGLFVAAWALVGDAGETYDLTNIGTLFAFVLVCLGVLVLRYKAPERPRPFRVRFVWPVTILGAATCLFLMAGLPVTAWRRFAVWLVIGLILYFFYGYRRSALRESSEAVAAPPIGPANPA